VNIEDNRIEIELKKNKKIGQIRLD